MRRYSIDLKGYSNPTTSNIQNSETNFKGHLQQQGAFSTWRYIQSDKGELPRCELGIATVYRTLTLLEEGNIVSSISFGVHGKKYEFGLGEHHDHLVCMECGAIEEFLDDTIEKQQELIAQAHNFKMTGHIMKITGICEACQAKNKL